MHISDIEAALRQAVHDLRLDLSGLTVYTEAATGPYCVTAAIANLAGAQKIYALGKDNAYGTVQDSFVATMTLVDSLGIENVVELVSEKNPNDLAKTDILTNTGNVRPIDRGTILSLSKQAAVIPLMYESWEFRPTDLDLAFCRESEIAVAGTNESHPQVGFRDYLGAMAAKLLDDAHFEIPGSRIALICENSFATTLETALRLRGAFVRLIRAPRNCPVELFAENDAILMCTSPEGSPTVIGSKSNAIIAADVLAEVSPGIKIFQFAWGGSIDYDAAKQAGLELWPPRRLPIGHMGILPSDLGWEPVIRLQTAGLKVGELLARSRRRGASVETAVQELEKTGFGKRM